MNQQQKWQFWIDRGGTFTDLVAQAPDGYIHVHKLLSENPEHYQDAAIQGIRDLLNLAPQDPLPTEQIEVVKMGTTVATNALLERQGDRLVLLINQGFQDTLFIGYQNRPQIFDRQIIRPPMLYEKVIEVEGRYDAQGHELIPLNLTKVKEDLAIAYQEGIRSCAIVLMHGYRYPKHEQAIATIAQEIGFTQISTSHQVSPLMKLVSRGDTTVVDAYLSPILRRYVNQIKDQLINPKTGYIPRLMFMQSNGGLVKAEYFQGKDSILSGPAGGIVGAVKISQKAGFSKIIGFDMGGTSTDVSHYAGEYERTFETEIAGVRLRAPMLSIHTVAAGGGSIIKFDGTRYRVGPESAGANPGPASYGKNGPLTITDCNVLVGKLQPEFFPKVFGITGNEPLNLAIVKEKFSQLATEIGDGRAPEAIATGFIAIAVAKMANAIKKISLQRGYDVSEYTLCCFGGAGGQHACLIADALGIKRIFLHPLAGVLSALGIGLADIRVLKEKAIEAKLTSAIIPQMETEFRELINQTEQELTKQHFVDRTSRQNLCKVHLKYEGTDSTLLVNWGEKSHLEEQFEQLHQQHYGFIIPQKELIVEAISVEAIALTPNPSPPKRMEQEFIDRQPVATVLMYTQGQWYPTPIYEREKLQPGLIISSPAIIIEATGTNIIELGWQGEITGDNNLILTKIGAISQEQFTLSNSIPRDPVLLEIFNNLFRSIAEQMGTTLQNTSYSVNIKERLDFSCAIFDRHGELVANAPHIPVHLGSMGESVKSLKDSGKVLKYGDVYASNNPYNGGTHLPDVTVITPVFQNENDPDPLFYVASRGHHADLGGITPGSMPPASNNITQEGILLDNQLIVSQGIFHESELSAVLTNSPYPVRNLNQNLADLQAQIAANSKGVQELQQLVNNYGQATVAAYMGYIQDNAEEAVRQAISVLQNGQFSCELDTGAKIVVTLTVNQKTRSATIDFTGTSPQLPNNFNAPSAIAKAAVLYVFRTLVNDDIPLNAGCLKPLTIIIPLGCMLNPQYPAAVVAGNVETSQLITDALYGALGIMAASQGTMNNFTFGDNQYQYYETICGGTGAGVNFAGTDAIHSHMTNSRLTDPEVLEWRFPVLLEKFTIRRHSGGKGRYPGGNGVMRQLRFLAPMTAGILSGRRVIAPFGLGGGEAGKPGKNWVKRQDGSIEELGGTAQIEMFPGDVFVIETPGGGGYS